MVKAAAVSAAAAVVWAEPTVNGLVRRPAYASAGSSSLTATSSATATLPTSGQVVDTRVASDGFTFIDLVYTDPGDGTFTVTAIARTAGCDCVIDGVGVSNITGRIADDSVQQTNGEVAGGVLVFELEPGAFVINVSWTGLMITCT